MRRMSTGRMSGRCAAAGLVAAGLLAAHPPGAEAAIRVEVGQVYCHGASAGPPHYYHSGVAAVGITLPGDDWWPGARAEGQARRRALARLAGDFARRVGEDHGVDVLLSPRCDWLGLAPDGNWLALVPDANGGAGVGTGAAAAIEAAAYARDGALVTYGPGERTAVDWTPDFKDVFRRELEASAGGRGGAAAGDAATGNAAAAAAGAGRASGAAAGDPLTALGRLLQMRPATGAAGALHAAAAAGDVAAAAAEIAAGADLRARDAAGNSPLDVAAAAGSAGVINLLVANGVAPGVLDRSLRDRPLHWAARAGSAEAAAVLLAHGAPAGVANASGETALHAAAAADAAGVVSVLLAHGADALARDRLGRTPRDVAVAAGSSAAAALLPAGP